MSNDRPGSKSPTISNGVRVSVKESQIKTEFMLKIKEMYPLCHAVVIPATYWRLLPYDIYVHHNGLLRAIEFKVDDHDVQAHQHQALIEVARNKGYAFVVRFMNDTRKFIVENYTNGDSMIFRPEPSNRQIKGDSKKDIDEPPKYWKDSVYRKTINYIMSFETTPLEQEIQAICQRNTQQFIRERLKALGR